MYGIDRKEIFVAV